MKPTEKKVWFPAKKYGWGWGHPCCWQGWAVSGVWLVLLCGGGIFLAPQSIGLFYFYAAILTLAFIVVCFIKGEKPRWRWGEDGNRPAGSLADRLAELEELRRRQLVSEPEYAAKRQEILRDV